MRSTGVVDPLDVTPALEGEGFKLSRLFVWHPKGEGGELRWLDRRRESRLLAKCLLKNEGILRWLLLGLPYLVVGELTSPLIVIKVFVVDLFS